jgi:hypothetical protein
VPRWGERISDQPIGICEEEEWIPTSWPAAQTVDWFVEGAFRPQGFDTDFAAAEQAARLRGKTPPIPYM